MNERLLSTAEVAELLDVTPRTVMRRWKRGDLPGCRLFGGDHGPLRFKRSEIEQTIASWSAARDVGRGSVTDPETTPLGNERIVGLVTDPTDEEVESAS